VTRAATADPDVFDNHDAGRYELMQGAEVVGMAVYVPIPGGIAITHTEVEPAVSGRGLGTRLAKAALDDARRQGMKVAPSCPFIAHYFERHPEDADLRA
jgi:uncharacterized protein